MEYENAMTNFTNRSTMSAGIQTLTLDQTADGEKRESLGEVCARLLGPMRGADRFALVFTLGRLIAVCALLFGLLASPGPQSPGLLPL